MDWGTKFEFEASAVSWARYSLSTRTLELGFRSGRTYRYFEVPQTVFDWLLQSESKGTYVNRLIKDRYEFEEVHAPSLCAADSLENALSRSIDASRVKSQRKSATET